MKLRILVVGSGGREHTLVWKLLQSPKVSQVYAAPGNAGTQAVAPNLDIPATDFEKVAKAALEHRIDLVVVGPEAPLVEGLVDLLEARGIAAFGPTRAAALLEGSKVFAKDLLHKYRIPCAGSRSFSSYEEARSYLQEQPLPVVVKADGLAAGKGSIVASSRKEAGKALFQIMKERIFGAAGDKVVIEECLMGREVSLLAFSDGETVAPMVPACDYKRVFDNDRGPNTGGMGGYSPPGFFSEEMAEEAKRTILEPTVRAMAREGTPFKGVLYAGLMITPEGPKVLEFNVRFGDPETQVTLPLLKTDLADILLAVVEGNLARINIEWDKGACVGVVAASKGYPGSYETGFPIAGLDRVDEGVFVFHAGTRADGGRVLTSGGRVLTVAAMGKSIAEARARVYLNVPCIRFRGRHYRKDIAARER